MSIPLFREQLPAAFFSGNRRRLLEQVGETDLVLLAAGSPPRRTADEDYPFFANRNFFYLSGIDQADSLLLLNRNGRQTEQTLYISPRDIKKERWTGRLLDPEQAIALSGCLRVQLLTDYPEQISQLLQDQQLTVWLDFSAENSQAEELKAWLSRASGHQAIQDAAPLLTRMRMVKQPEEIDALRKAIDLTGRGLDAMRQVLRPGGYEFDLLAAFRQALAEEGILETAFPSIIAAGENSLCLHHMQPYGRIQPGDLVQVDVGAAVAGLCADISRVFPASGKMSRRQAEVYQLVRDCQETAFSMIRPGISLSDINRQCQETARQGLIRLGLLGSEDTVTRYFWHSVSHHLGLDVHDASDRNSPLAAGMVLTVEPGIYIEEEQIGIRIEDDVLVTENGCEILSAEIERDLAGSL